MFKKKINFHGLLKTELVQYQSDTHLGIWFIKTGICKRKFEKFFVLISENYRYLLVLCHRGV